MSSEPILVKRVAPVARRQPHTLSCAFGTRWDDYYWLRDDAREQPEVLAYLAEENAYHDAYMARLSVSQGTLYKELVGRLKPDDSSVPVFDRGYWYYRKYLPGQEHPIYARRYASMDNVEEILLDRNERAKGHSF